VNRVTSLHAQRGHLLIILAVALAARLLVFGYLYVLQGGSPADIGGGDQTGYMAMAHYVNASGDLSADLFMARGSLLPMIAGVLYRLVGEEPFVVIALHILVGTITCALVYHLAAITGFSTRVAFLAGLVAALEPALVTNNVLFLTETLFNFFFVLGLIWLVYLVERPSWDKALLSGVLIGLATLTRPTTLVFPVVTLIVLLCARVRRWWRYVVPHVVIFLVFVGAIVFRNWYYNGIVAFSTEGEWTLLFVRAVASERRATGDPPHVIYARYIQEIERRLGHEVPETIESPSSAIWSYFQPATPETFRVISEMAWEKNLAYPFWYVANIPVGLVRFFAMDRAIPLPIPIQWGINIVTLALAGWGVWTMWRSPERRQALLLLGVSILYVIGITVAVATAALSVRHRLPATIPLLILAAQGLDALWERWRERTIWTKAT
jgi:4-amino-4-deoxy-L-arabinose transferase-like glycosyltransferase